MGQLYLFLLLFVRFEQKWSSVSITTFSRNLILHFPFDSDMFSINDSIYV